MAGLRRPQAEDLNLAVSGRLPRSSYAQFIRDRRSLWLGMAIKRKPAEDGLSPVGRKEGAQRRGPGPLFPRRRELHLLRREAADDRKPGGGGGPGASRQTRPARRAAQALLTPPRALGRHGPPEYAGCPAQRQPPAGPRQADRRPVMATNRYSLLSYFFYPCRRGAKAVPERHRDGSRYSETMPIAARPEDPYGCRSPRLG